MSTIEEKYQKLSQREHVLLRSGMYIGSVKKQVEELWVAKETEDGFPKMEKTMVEYSPGFMKIFDEVLTNATDHSFRDSSVTTIKVEYSKETGEISVWNNGSGIPVQLHKEHNIYVPELIFGHLLSGSNYNDSTTRTGAGTNGLGSKCILHSTPIPLFNGEIKRASEINVGDILIGDDGTPRKVLNKTTGFGEMYKIKQNYGEEYIVNNNHTLTLHMPDHKVIFWNKNGWSSIWWNNDKKCIQTKFIKVFDKNIKCQECGIILNSRLSRHYKRQHKNKQIPKSERKTPTRGNLNIPIVKTKYDEMKLFLNTIPFASTFDINIQDYLKLNKTTQRRMAGVRGDCIKFEEKEVELDPYILGLWLGDGMKHGRSYACYGENDTEILDYIQEWCDKNDAIIQQSNCNKYTYTLHSNSNFGKKNSSPLRNILKKYNLVNNKHIPKDYLINSRENRLKLLAGLIDTDGTSMRDGTRIVITQSHIHKTLIDDIIYLVRSLGFLCCSTSFMAKYKITNGEERESLTYKVNISGNIDDIPTRLPRKKCSKPKKQNTDKSTGQIKIEKVEDNHYIGIHIDGNERFVINDFTVTHNCTNIFSKKFIVETLDSDTKKKFIQEFSDNMTQKSKPKITTNSGRSYTKITFIPEYSRFGMNGLEDDTILLIRKRVLDCIACTNNNVQVYLNGDKLKGKGLIDYTKYFFEGEKVITESHIEKIKKNGEITEYIWEYAIVPYTHFEQVSFVNGNATNQGGKHVDYILYQIINKLKKTLEDKKKLKELKPNFIKDKMFVFLRATVANPTFNSQTKEQLTTPSKDFGCSITVSDAFITKLYKSSITEEIVEFCKLKESASLSKHSVSGDTPLLLKDKNNKIIIKTIEKITDIFTETHDNNDYGKSDYKVWTEDGWTDIIHVMRHKSSKQMYRVLTHTGFVDVTEDHSLLTSEKEEISPKDCIIGDELLHSFPDFTDNKLKLNFSYKELKSIELHNYASYLKIPYYRGTKDKLISLIENKHIEYQSQHFIDLEYDNTINYEEAWVMGLFWADGTAGFYTDKHGYTIYNFAIHNTNKNFLIKTQEIFSKIYPNEKTSIYTLERDYTRQTKYQLQFNGYCKIAYIIKKYIDLFYYGKNDKTKFGNKCIPIEILNAKRNIRENFLRGVYCGDGRRHNIDNKGVKEISIESKISSQGIYYLAKSLGYFVSIQCREDKPNIFILILGKYYYNKHPNKIKKIIKLGYTNEYVYDLETKNHHFQAGIGRMIVHNTDGKKANKIYIPKLEDAIWAGTARSNQCTLILTEGDSAKTFAMWGRSIVGPEKYGVMPLKGKSLNVRDASISQLIGNEEINNLKQILGLKQDRVYKDVSDLRYGKVMLLTDSDVDGSHIKSLLVNMFHYWWPSLIKMDYIQTLKTPIVKAIKGKQTMEFYTEQDYLKWKATGINLNSYQIRYFKGLGTSKKEDAKDTFKRLEELKVDYYYKDKKCDEAILLAFDKDKNTKVSTKKNDSEQEESMLSIIKCSDKRKNWLANYDKNLYLDVKENRVSYQDLINKELIHFSIYDNLRSIPSLCDGLKPSQRKILYYMLSKNKKDLIKVAQLAGYVSAETSYHHGEASLQGAIINMAQDFVGSNNINLLVPDGNFGSRLQCGKDAASPRYIFTKLHDTTDMIFNPNDTPLLEFLNDDGMQIEPEWYLPIIPMILVNGCEGIGTGYSTFIPSFNPKEIIYHLMKMIDDENYTPTVLNPYFKGFNGIVQEVDKGSYVTKGKWERLSNKQIKITEIPIGTGVTNYKEFLESLIESNTNKKQNGDKSSKPKKKRFELKDVQNHTKDENDKILFIVEFKNENELNDLINNNTLEKELKLVKPFSTNNMYLFNQKLILTKYNTPIDILLEFFDIRIEYYVKRREYLIAKLQKELLFLQSKARFITEYIEGKLDINKRSKEHIINLLKNNNYPQDDNSYDYLLRLPIYSLTLEKINDLNTQCEKKTSELNFIKNNTPEQLWKIDLEQLLKKL